MHICTNKSYFKCKLGWFNFTWDKFDNLECLVVAQAEWNEGLVFCSCRREGGREGEMGVVVVKSCQPVLFVIVYLNTIDGNKVQFTASYL